MSDYLRGVVLPFAFENRRAGLGRIVTCLSGSQNSPLDLWNTEPLSSLLPEFGGACPPNSGALTTSVYGQQYLVAAT